VEDEKGDVKTRETKKKCHEEKKKRWGDLNKKKNSQADQEGRGRRKLPPRPRDGRSGGGRHKDRRKKTEGQKQGKQKIGELEGIRGRQQCSKTRSKRNSKVQTSWDRVKNRKGERGEEKEARSSTHGRKTVTPGLQALGKSATRGKRNEIYKTEKGLEPPNAIKQKKKVPPGDRLHKDFRSGETKRGALLRGKRKGEKRQKEGQAGSKGK